MNKKMILISLTISAILIGVLLGACFGKFKATEKQIPVETPQEILTNQHYLQRIDKFSKEAVAKSPIVMLGDSLTEIGMWAEYFPASKIINRGIGGDNTIGILNRLDQIITLKPKVIFMMIGTNDLIRGVTADEAFERYTKIIDRLQASLPHTKIVIQSVPPVNFGHMPSGYVYWRPIIEFNEKLKRLSEEKSMPFLDLHAALADSTGGLKLSNTTDGIHFTSEAYNVWVGMIRPFIT